LFHREENALRREGTRGRITPRLRPGKKKGKRKRTGADVWKGKTTEELAGETRDLNRGVKAGVHAWPSYGEWGEFVGHIGGKAK